MTVLDHLKNKSGRDRQGCNQRNIDAAANHDDRHGEPENAEHRHVLQQGQHVLGREKAAQEDRKRQKQHGEDGEHDLLLIEPKAFHPLVPICPSLAVPSASLEQLFSIR